MRMELDQMIKEFAQTSGAPWTSNVTWCGLGCCNTASRTEPTTANSRHTRCPRFAWRAHSINVALRKALLEDLAELHLAGTALERAARVPLKSCAALRTMKLRHGCRLPPQFSGGAPAIPFHRPLQLLVRRLAPHVIWPHPTATLPDSGHHHERSTEPHTCHRTDRTYQTASRVDPETARVPRQLPACQKRLVVRRSRYR